MTALFDFDGTLVPERNNLYWHMVHALPNRRCRVVKAAAFTQALAGGIAGVTVGAINGDQMYKALLLAVFSGLPVEMVEETADELADRIDEMLFAEMQQVLDESEEPRVMVTSNTEAIVGGFCSRRGMDCVATRLHTAGGRYTGLVDGELNKGAEKVRRIIEAGIDPSEATAYGNTIEDIEMLDAAERAVMVNPADELATRRAMRAARTIDARPAHGSTTDPGPGRSTG